MTSVDTPTPKLSLSASTYDSLNLLEALTPGDQRWLFGVGIERQRIANFRVLEEGASASALYFVLEGLLGVSARAMPTRQLARLGPGQICGEMSFIEDGAATADVTVLENSLLLEIPVVTLQEKLAVDSGFASRFYRGIAFVMSRRLRGAVRQMGQMWSDVAPALQESDRHWSGIQERLGALKAQIEAAEQEVAQHDGVIHPETRDRVLKHYDATMGHLNDVLGLGSSISEQAKEELGHQVQRELLPYVLRSTLSERSFSKPRGYAGDYLTIEGIYDDVPTGTCPVGALLDRALRDQPGPTAVRNRRGLLAEEIGRSCGDNPEPITRVTSLASGPATELFDAFAALEDPGALQAQCIDIDPMALAHVRGKCAAAGLTDRFALHQGNLVYLATGRKRLDLPPQDLVYSIGLIDYFNDKFVTRLLDYIHTLLKPGGRVILGNFHVDNPTKAMLDHVLDWRLIHRTEEDMHRLFENSRFGRRCTRIRFEEQRVNLFAECVR